MYVLVSAFLLDVNVFVSMSLSEVLSPLYLIVNVVLCLNSVVVTYMYLFLARFRW